MGKSLQKTRSDINLQISSVVHLGGDYKTAQKKSGKKPPQGTGAPPEDVTNVEFWHFGATLGRPLVPTVTTGGEMFMVCYSAYNRL